MPPVLEIIDLKKYYDKIKAVDGISFKIEQGVCFGLLGPNGAGKTTALEVIEGIIPATSGTILYREKERSSSFHQEIGIQFQNTTLLSYLTVHETLKTFSALYTRKNNIQNLIEVCHLSDIIDQQNDKLSGGQKQRLLLAIALVNDPELIFLDEPSTGLDPQARRYLWDIVSEIKKQCKTVILTTHYMEEAEFLCDEVAIVDHGKIIVQGKPSDLIDQNCKTSMISLPAKSLLPVKKQVPFEYREYADMIQIAPDNINRTLTQLMELKVDLGEIKVNSPNLEDVFLKLTGRTLRE